jgi:hypothetical protein
MKVKLINHIKLENGKVIAAGNEFEVTGFDITVPDQIAIEFEGQIVDLLPREVELCTPPSAASVAPRNDKLKLFVWDEVLCDYTDGIMFALAPDAETAREMIRAESDYISEEELAQEPVVYDNEPCVRIVRGGG